MTLFG